MECSTLELIHTEKTSAAMAARNLAMVHGAFISRVYGGSHWLSDNRDSLIADRNLGNYVAQNFMGSP